MKSSSCMYPHIDVNLWAIGTALVSSFLLGGLWYGPLWGKVWLKEVGFKENDKPGKQAFLKAAILNLMGTFLKNCFNWF